MDINYLKKESIEWTDFEKADTNPVKLKVTLIIFGWSPSKMGVGVLFMEL